MKALPWSAEVSDRIIMNLINKDAKLSGTPLEVCFQSYNLSKKNLKPVSRKKVLNGFSNAIKNH